MATALDIIERALRLNKVLGTGETLTSDEASDGLDALNTMLESWSLERLFVYQVVRTAKVLTSGDGNYTVGSGGDISITRPDQLEDACTISNGTIDYGLRLINDQQYQSIAFKTQTGLPEYLFFDPKYPLAEVNLYPVPNQAYTLTLTTWQSLQSFATLTDVVALPRGYKRAIEYNLAIETAPEFGGTIAPELMMVAEKSKVILKRINAPNYVLAPESVHLSPRRSGFNIYRG